MDHEPCEEPIPQTGVTSVGSAVLVEHWPPNAVGTSTEIAWNLSPTASSSTTLSSPLAPEDVVPQQVESPHKKQKVGDEETTSQSHLALSTPLAEPVSVHELSPTTTTAAIVPSTLQGHVQAVTAAAMPKVGLSSLESLSALRTPIPESSPVAPTSPSKPIPKLATSSNLIIHEESCATPVTRPVASPSPLQTFSMADVAMEDDGNKGAVTLPPSDASNHAAPTSPIESTAVPAALTSVINSDAVHTDVPAGSINNELSVQASSTSTDSQSNGVVLMASSVSREFRHSEDSIEVPRTEDDASSPSAPVAVIPMANPSPSKGSSEGTEPSQTQVEPRVHVTIGAAAVNVVPAEAAAMSTALVEPATCGDSTLSNSVPTVMAELQELSGATFAGIQDLPAPPESHDHPQTVALRTPFEGAAAIDVTEVVVHGQKLHEAVTSTQNESTPTRQVRKELASAPSTISRPPRGTNPVWILDSSSPRKQSTTSLNEKGQKRRFKRKRQHAAAITGMSEDGRDRALQRAAPIESNGRDNDGEAKRTRLQPHDNIEIRPEQHHNLVWSDAAVKEKAQSTSTEVVASAVSTNDSNGKAKNSSADGTLGNHVDKVKPSRRKKSKSSPRGPLAQDNAIDLTAPLEARGPPVEIVIHDDDDDDIPVTSTVQLGTDSTTLSRQGTSSSSDSRVVMAPTKATAPSPSRAHLSTRSKHTPSGRRRRGRPRKLVDEPSVVDLNHDATVPAVILIHDSDDSDNANNVPTNESPRSSSIPPNPTPPLASLEDLLPPQGVDVPVVEGEQPTAPALVDDAQRNRILGNAVEALVADMPLLLGDDFTPLVDAVTLAALSNVDSSRAMVSSVLDGLPEDDDISNTLSLALGEDAPVACAAAAQGGDSSVPEDQDIHTERSAAQVEECFTSVELSTAQPAVEELSPQSLEAMPAPVDNGDMLRACKDKVEVATEEHRVDQALDSTVDITENVDGIRFHEQQPPSPTIVQTLAPAQNNVVCQSSSAVADALLLLPEGPLPSATPPLDPTEETPATVYSSCVSKPFFKAEPTVVATTMAKGDDETATGVPHQRKRKRVPAADPGGDQIDLPTGEAKESASSIGPADDEMSSEGYLSENDVGDSDSEIGDGKPDEAIRDDDGMPCPSPSAPFFPGPRKEVMPYVGTEPEASAQAAPLASPQRDEVDNAAPSPDKPCQVTEKDAVGADTPLPSLYDRPQFPCKELLIAEAFDESDKSMEPHENASDSDDDSAPPPPPPSPQVPPPRRLPLVDLTNTPPPASPLRLQAKQLPPHIYNANPPSHASATTSSSSSSNSSSSDSEGDRPVAPPDHPHRYAKQVADLLLSENEGDDDENDEDDVEFGGSDEPTDQVDSDSSDVVFVGVVPAASSGHAAAEPHGRPLESVHPVLRGMYQVAAHEATWTGTWGFTETTASAPTKFTYKCIAPHWSSHDLRVPINGVYNGYFVMISDGHGRPHRVLERGVHLEFTELAPGSYVVDGSGRNKFGPFSLRGYYQWGNPLTLVKVYTRPA